MTKSLTNFHYLIVYNKKAEESSVFCSGEKFRYENEK